MNRLGRNWLSEVKLDWTILFHRCKENLNNISKPNDITEKLENLVKNCSEIFVSELGTIKGIKTRVNIGTNSLPKFMKARGAPFTMLEAVEAEINRMEKKQHIKICSVFWLDKPNSYFSKTRSDDQIAIVQ